MRESSSVYNDSSAYRSVYLMIAGVIRDGGPELSRRITALDQIFSRWPRFWHVVESDSSDDTSALLVKVAQDIEHFEYTSLGDLQHKLPVRTDRIAHCRNRYLDRLNAIPEALRPTCLVVCDLDGVNDELDASELPDIFADPAWGGVTANQRDAYYDIFALRHHLWSPEDCWRQAAFFEQHGLSRKYAKLISIYAKMICIPRDAPAIEVDSAFGGLAMYRTRFLEGARYLGVGDDGEEVCEHIEFNAQVRRNGGKIFIKPALINGGINEHVQYWWPLIRDTRA